MFKVYYKYTLSFNIGQYIECKIFNVTYGVVFAAFKIYLWKMGKNEIAILVGNNIRRIIKDKDFKTRSVAEKCDIEVATLRKYINGDFVMGIDKLHKIATALEIEINELFK